MKYNTFKPILWVGIFSIAMGFLETAVVVYLRAIYYPDGFNFPMKIIASDIAITEILREAATLIMLVFIGIMTGRTKTEKFAYFIYSFAIWDIFYYVFLKILLDWPESFFTWDILFLIPTVWVGPVIAPVINSCCMIVLAFIIIYYTNYKETIFKRIEWILLFLGALIILFSYVYDYSAFILERFEFADIFSENKSIEINAYASNYIPGIFKWSIFNIGLIMHILAIGLFVKRLRKS